MYRSFVGFYELLTSMPDVLLAFLTDPTEFQERVWILFGTGRAQAAGKGSVRVLS